jgi:hypothetical protein
MKPLFAHHDMLEALDFLGFHPVTPVNHSLALATYALLAFALFFRLKWAGRRLSRGVRSAHARSEPLAVITPRAVEG